MRDYAVYRALPTYRSLGVFLDLALNPRMKSRRSWKLILNGHNWNLLLKDTPLILLVMEIRLVIEALVGQCSFYILVFYDWCSALGLLDFTFIITFISLAFPPNKSKNYHSQMVKSNTLFLRFIWTKKKKKRKKIFFLQILIGLCAR